MAEPFVREFGRSTTDSPNPTRAFQPAPDSSPMVLVGAYEHLRCKKPHRVRNEVRAHMIAYNLIRQVMSEAACAAGAEPWRISFKATMTTLTEMLPVLGMIRDPADLCRVLLACCQQHRVGDRADRYEPRAVKRRPKPYKLMQKPPRDYKPGEA